MQVSSDTDLPNPRRKPARAGWPPRQPGAACPSSSSFEEKACRRTGYRKCSGKQRQGGIAACSHGHVGVSGVGGVGGQATGQPAGRHQTPKHGTGHASPPGFLHMVAQGPRPCCAGQPSPVPSAPSLHCAWDGHTRGSGQSRQMRRGWRARGEPPPWAAQGRTGSGHLLRWSAQPCPFRAFPALQLFCPDTMQLH